MLAVDSVEAANAGYNAVAQYVESLAGTFRQNGEDVEIALDTANSLFGQEGVEWEEPFLDALAASYGAGVQQVDYRAPTEAARQAINGWTAEQTRDKIPELIPKDVLDTLTRLVLVNALYLKAPWATPFEKSATQDGDFHLADGSTVSVPMMRATEGVSGTSGDGWSLARIPYAGATLTMTVVLPDDGDVDALVSRRARRDPRRRLGRSRRPDHAEVGVPVAVATEGRPEGDGHADGVQRRRRPHRDERRGSRPAHPGRAARGVHRRGRGGHRGGGRDSGRRRARVGADAG